MPPSRLPGPVDRATKLTLLGFGFLYRAGEVKVRADQKARRRAKDRLRRLTSRRWRVSMERRIREINRFTVGWTSGFRSNSGFAVRTFGFWTRDPYSARC